MADCPACRAVNRDSARFCLDCGHALHAVPPVASGDSWACSGCGKENRAGRKFCKHCGSAMLAATGIAAVAAPSPTVPGGVASMAAAVAAQDRVGAAEAVAISSLEPEVPERELVVAGVGARATVMPPPVVSDAQMRARSAPEVMAAGPSQSSVAAAAEVVVTGDSKVAPAAASSLGAASALAFLAEPAATGRGQVTTAIDGVVTSLSAGVNVAQSSAATVGVPSAVPSLASAMVSPGVDSDAAAGQENARSVALFAGDGRDDAVPSPSEDRAGAAAMPSGAVAANVAATVTPAIRPWWLWTAGALLLGMAVAAMMLGGVFSPATRPSVVTPAASTSAAIALQPGTRLLREQTAPAVASRAAAVLPPVASPVVAAPAQPEPLPKPSAVPAPAREAEVPPSPQPQHSMPTKAATVAPAGKMPAKSEAATKREEPKSGAAAKGVAKASSQHDEIRRKKEELKRQLGLQ